MKIFVLFLMIKMAYMLQQPRTPATQQLLDYRQRTRGPVCVLTASAGAPIEYTDTSTLNRPLLHNELFIDTITHVNRKLIPVRIVHAKGTGAFGYFEVTHDITHICKANLFSAVGKKTPIAARFSLSAIEKGGSDTARETRGFAIKFYTEEGNFDIVGFNTPVFTFKDPLQFAPFILSQRRNPATDLFDDNMLWDFLILNPETFFINLVTFGDRGIPDGYTYTPGFSIHTYELVNSKSEKSFVRFHFLPDGGIKNLTTEQAINISVSDPDYATRGLYNDIALKKFPSWTMKIQVLSLADVKRAKFDVFDVTKILPEDEYPLQTVGRFVLNRNAVNHFAEIEQLALCPGNVVPGILGAPDKVFEARRLAYRDAQNYRLGANFHKIPVNCPRLQNMPYNRDGSPPVGDNGRDVPNYYPNSFNGPVPYVDKNRVELLQIYEEKPNNTAQARDFYRGITIGERNRMIVNIVSKLESAIPELQEKAIKIFANIDLDLGRRVKQGLLRNRTKNDNLVEKK